VTPRPRVAVVHQGFIPHYRIAFFEQLARSNEIDYVVFHGKPPSGRGHRAATKPLGFPNVQVENRELTVAGRQVVAQPIVRTIARGSFAGAVLGAELKLLSNVAVAALLSAWGKPVVLWGHGYDKRDEGGEGPIRGVAGALKSWYARRAAGYLAYTTGGAERLLANGVDPGRVTVVQNTLDMPRQEELRRRFENDDPSALKHELGLAPDTHVLLYIGRLYREKRVEQLVEVARGLRQPGASAGPFKIVVIGDGPDRARVEGFAGMHPEIQFMGELYDEDVARWLRVATAVVMPGKVGLTVNHALAHGVPILTRATALHAPEIDYVQDGENGLIVDGNLDAYTAAISEVLRTPGLQQQLARGAMTTGRDLSLEAMVSAFHDGVTRALRLRS
jgi:glycosyltransferase involved in cell wall biosynthesis